MVIASFVTAVELSMNAWFFELHKILGIFIPLIVTNCAIIGRAEAFASKNNITRSAVDGLAVGVGFTLVLMALGGLRELVGQGTLFYQAHLMFGEAARGLTLTLGDDFKGLLLAILPPGAFIGLGLMIALKNLLDARVARRQASQPEMEAAGEAPEADPLRQ
jgi:electron transport complex protein RnfE